MEVVWIYVISPSILNMVVFAQFNAYNETFLEEQLRTSGQALS